MQILLNASYSIKETDSFSENNYSCEEYDCGCDVKGSCNPDCPSYNPSPDCWVGG